MAEAGRTRPCGAVWAIRLEPLLDAVDLNGVLAVGYRRFLPTVGRGEHLHHFVDLSARRPAATGTLDHPIRGVANVRMLRAAYKLVGARAYAAESAYCEKPAIVTHLSHA